MKALVINKGNVDLVSDRPIPAIRPGCLLVRTVAIALNPGDWRTVQSPRPTANALLGCDFSGEIIEVGAGPNEQQWQVGEKVFGCSLGGGKDSELGAFAEYILVRQDLTMRLPSNISMQDASTIGLSVLTVAQGLFHKMGLQLPGTDVVSPTREFLLIYGGSTAAGTLAIQLANLAGYRVLATCSPSNSGLVESRGAQRAFDYKDPNCAKQIYDYTDGHLKLVWDTIGETEQVVQLCMDAMSEAGGKYGTINFHNIPRADVKHTKTILWTAFGEDFDIPGVVHLEASQEETSFLQQFVRLVEKLLADGRLKPHPAKIGEGGLAGVPDGLEQLRQWKISGGKLVYNV